MSKVIGYLSGCCRNDDQALSHTYALTQAGRYWPMCDYGWNRSNGSRFSILRGPVGTEGDCKICARRVSSGLRPVVRARPHKTRWL